MKKEKGEKSSVAEWHHAREGIIRRMPWQKLRITNYEFGPLICTNWHCFPFTLTPLTLSPATGTGMTNCPAGGTPPLNPYTLNLHLPLVLLKF